ncbi:MAG: hypothetical protein P8Q52_08965 [Acidimicrobiales bacterium]|nr:hypothetical protein [Acidimicrobiales bacterium]
MEARHICNAVTVGNPAPEREIAMKRYVAGLIGLVMVFITGCVSQADTVSKNLSTAAEEFEINRRIVMFNGITDNYLLSIEGRCSIEVDAVDNQLEVTCKVGEDAFEKHFLGLSDNVSYLVEQLEPVDANEFRTRVIFRPETILPDVDLKTSSNDND